MFIKVKMIVLTLFVLAAWGSAWAQLSRMSSSRGDRPVSSSSGALFPGASRLVSCESNFNTPVCAVVCFDEMIEDDDGDDVSIVIKLLNLRESTDLGQLVACDEEVPVTSITAALGNKRFAGFTRVTKNSEYRVSYKALQNRLKCDKNNRPTITVKSDESEKVQWTTDIQLDTAGSLRTKYCGESLGCSNEWGEVSVTPEDNPIIGEIVTYTLTASSDMKVAGFSVDSLWKAAPGRIVSMPVAVSGENPYSYVIVKSGEYVAKPRFSHRPFNVATSSLEEGVITVTSKSDETGATAFHRDSVKVDVKSKPGYYCYINSVTNANGTVTYEKKALDSGHNPSAMFEMPGNDVMVNVSCEYKAYEVSTNSNDICTLKLNKSTVGIYETVVVTPTCKAGYNAGKLFLDCGAASVSCPEMTMNGDMYIFEMPESNVTVKSMYRLSFGDKNSAPYTVNFIEDGGDYYAEYGSNLMVSRMVPSRYYSVDEAFGVKVVNTDVNQSVAYRKYKNYTQIPGDNSNPEQREYHYEITMPAGETVVSPFDYEPIDVVNDGKCSITAPDSAEAGSMVSYSVECSRGYEIDKVTFENYAGSGLLENTNPFEMPSYSTSGDFVHGVTIKAVSRGSEYTVALGEDAVHVSLNGDKARTDSVVYVTAAAEYRIDTLYIETEKGQKIAGTRVDATQFMFTMPASNVIVHAATGLNIEKQSFDGCTLDVASSAQEGETIDVRYSCFTPSNEQVFPSLLVYYESKSEIVPVTVTAENSVYHFTMPGKNVYVYLGFKVSFGSSFEAPKKKKIGKSYYAQPGESIKIEYREQKSIKVKDLDHSTFVVFDAPTESKAIYYVMVTMPWGKASIGYNTDILLPIVGDSHCQIQRDYDYVTSYITINYTVTCEEEFKSRLSIWYTLYHDGRYYYNKSWDITPTLNDDGSYSFQLPDISEWVEMKLAVYSEYKDKNDYEIKLTESVAGLITLSRNTAKRGNTVGITANETCTFKNVSAVDENGTVLSLEGSETYKRFQMPSSNVSIVGEMSCKDFNIRLADYNRCGISDLPKISHFGKTVDFSVKCNPDSVKFKIECDLDSYVSDENSSSSAYTYGEIGGCKTDKYGNLLADYTRLDGSRFSFVMPKMNVKISALKREMPHKITVADNIKRVVTVYDVSSDSLFANDKIYVKLDGTGVLSFTPQIQVNTYSKFENISYTKDSTGSYTDFSKKTSFTCSKDSPCYVFTMPGDDVSVGGSVKMGEYVVSFQNGYDHLKNCNLENRTVHYGDIVDLSFLEKCADKYPFYVPDLPNGVELLKKSSGFYFIMPPQNVKVWFTFEENKSFDLKPSSDMQICDSDETYCVNYNRIVYVNHTIHMRYIQRRAGRDSKFFGYEIAYTDRFGNYKKTNLIGSAKKEYEKQFDRDLFYRDTQMPPGKTYISPLVFLNYNYRSGQYSPYVVDESNGHCRMNKAKSFNYEDRVDVNRDLGIVCDHNYKWYHIDLYWYHDLGLGFQFYPDEDMTFMFPYDGDAVAKLYSSVYLDWNTAADSVRLDTLDFENENHDRISGDKMFCTDEMKCYKGEMLDSALRKKIGFKTLYPVNGITTYTSRFNKKTVVISGDAADGLLMISANIPIDSVFYSRTFEPGVFSTITLPFDVDVANIEGAEIGKFKGVKQDSKGTWYLAVGRMNGAHLKANTPYMIYPSKKQVTIKGCVVMNSTKTQEVTYEHWHFLPNYEVKTWEEGDPEIGFAYGIAGSNDNKNGVKKGDFVRVAAGASISPTRGYLLFRKDAQGVAPGKNYAASYSLPAADMPEVLKVKFEDEEDDAENVPMVIGTVDARTGEFKPADHRWFDMKGRLLDAKPVQKGVYYHNGKRVVIK